MLAHEALVFQRKADKVKGFQWICPLQSVQRVLAPFDQVAVSAGRRIVSFIAQTALALRAHTDIRRALERCRSISSNAVVKNPHWKGVGDVNMSSFFRFHELNEIVAATRDRYADVFFERNERVLWSVSGGATHGIHFENEGIPWFVHWQ